MCDAQAVAKADCNAHQLCQADVKVQIDSLTVQMSYLGQAACRILIIT